MYITLAELLQLLALIAIVAELILTFQNHDNKKN